MLLDISGGDAEKGRRPDGQFEPTIVAFCCHFCAYTAADLAGTMRLQYPPNVRIVRLPCTGKVDVRLLLEAFEKGADGVYVAGCLEGDCHFLTGNIRAKKRVAYAKRFSTKSGSAGSAWRCTTCPRPWARDSPRSPGR